MALPPFWLDDCFEGSTDDFESGLLKSRHFKASIARAQAAALECQETIDKNPGLCGPSPAQSARRAFLDGMQVSESFNN